MSKEIINRTRVLVSIRTLNPLRAAIASVQGLTL